MAATHLPLSALQAGAGPVTREPAPSLQWRERPSQLRRWLASACCGGGLLLEGRHDVLEEPVLRRGLVFEPGVERAGPNRTFLAERNCLARRRPVKRPQTTDTLQRPALGSRPLVRRWIRHAAPWITASVGFPKSPSEVQSEGARSALRRASVLRWSAWATSSDIQGRCPGGTPSLRATHARRERNRQYRW